jgi:hypothetical protein
MMPMIPMAATCTKNIIETIEKIIGFHLDILLAWTFGDAVSSSIP